MCLPELRDRFWKGAGGWRDLVNEETEKRVAASQKSEHQPHGLDRPVAPWTGDRNGALDKWCYFPPCDYFDEHGSKEIGTVTRATTILKTERGRPGKGLHPD